MKKKVALLSVLALLVGLLSGCGSDPNSYYLTDIKSSKYVTLGEYKGVAVTATQTEVTDDYVESYISYILSSNQVSTPVTDRAVEEGDTVNIDYVGKVDGKEFEGGTDQAYDLTIGSNSFIAGFETGLIGAKTGDVLDVDITFSDDYSNADLAGKDAVFNVTVNSITVKTTPELTDAFVQTLAVDGVTTVAQYREYAKKLLTDDAASAYKEDVQNAAIKVAMANATFKEAPEALVNHYVETITENLTAQATQYGMDLTTFMQNYYGLAEADFQTQLKEGAKSSANQAILCQAIADKEKIKVSDKDAEKQMETEYASLGYESLDAYKEKVSVKEYRDYLLCKKVLEFIADNAVVSEEPATEAVTTEEATTAEATTTEAATTEATTTEAVTTEASTAAK